MTKLIERRREVEIRGNESDSGREGEEYGEDNVVCDDVTTSPVQIASRVSATTHSPSRVNIVIKYNCA